MKKFLLILTGMLLFPMTAQARTYWNSVDNKYSHCGRCRACREFLFRHPTGELASRPDCTSCDDGDYLQLIHADNADGVFTTYNDCWKIRVTCPSNCSSCSDSSTCTSCNDGYTLTNGSCVMAAPSCTDGQYADSTGKCQSCSNISVTNGTCSACSSDGTCTNATCDKGYAYNASTSACTPVVTCKPPLKFSADYSGDCDGCCVE